MDVALKGELKTTKTEAFDECKKIIQEKAAMGWELVQVIAVKNEKNWNWNACSLYHYF
ncbi:DUF4177 domain-containing protein [Peptoniphilus porci]|uniref:DUF4177 domain-containing protein n=1 Tax=Peptoniphilus porci TaxID=2652280 RepID=UPI0009531B44